MCKTLNLSFESNINTIYKTASENESFRMKNDVLDTLIHSNANSNNNSNNNDDNNDNKYNIYCITKKTYEIESNELVVTKYVYVHFVAIYDNQ